MSQFHMSMVVFYFTVLSIVTLVHLEEENHDANLRLFCLHEYNCDWCIFLLTLKVYIKQYILPVHDDFRYNKDPLFCNLRCVFDSMACENC